MFLFFYYVYYSYHRKWLTLLKNSKIRLPFNSFAQFLEPPRITGSSSESYAIHATSYPGNPTNFHVHHLINRVRWLYDGIVGIVVLILLWFLGSS